MNPSDCLPKNWGDWAAFFQILQFVIVVLALLYAKGQVDEAGRARKLQATRELLNEIGNEEVRELRTWVLDEMPTSGALSNEEHKKARRVAVAYDRVGYMVEQRLVPDDALFKFQQDEIEQLWLKLKPVVEQVRTRPNRQHYCTHLEYLATQWFPRIGKKYRGRGT